MTEIEVINNPCSEGVAIVIFGITGDLARRKLMPGLYENEKQGRLPQPLFILGFARRPWTDEKMRDVLRQGVIDYERSEPIDEEVLQRLLQNAFYVESDFQDPEGYTELESTLQKLGVRNTLFYLSTPWFLFNDCGKYWAFQAGILSRWLAPDRG